MRALFLYYPSNAPFKTMRSACPHWFGQLTQEISKPEGGSGILISQKGSIFPPAHCCQLG